MGQSIGGGMHTALSAVTVGEMPEPSINDDWTSLVTTIAHLPEPDEELREGVIRTEGPRCADGNGTLTPLFFSNDLVDIGRAKAICAKCPLQTHCLGDALARHEPWGVWGGELLQRGRVVTDKRGPGRPRLQRHPPTTYDEMGVVA